MRLALLLCFFSCAVTCSFVSEGIAASEGTDDNAAPAPASPPGRTTSKVETDSDTRFLATHHFNSNALVQGIYTQQVAIARTVSGHLLTFDPKTFEFRRTLSLPAPASLLTQVGERILIGCENGQVLEFLASRDLSDAPGHVTAIATLSGAPLWIGDTPSLLLPESAEEIDPERRFVAFVKKSRLDRDGDRVDEYWVSLPASGSRNARRRVRVTSVSSYLGIRPLLTSFHLDAAGTLWVGMDRGEWGGAVAYIDLVSGKQGDHEQPGVYGIAHVHGKLLAFGGITHRGYRQCFVTQLNAPKSADESVDGASGNDSAEGDTSGREPKIVCQFSNGREWRPRTQPFTTPEYPITQIYEHQHEGKEAFLLLSFGELFRTFDFESFEFLGEAQGLRYAWDHPHLEGPTPALRSPFRSSKEPLEITGVSARDGWFRWRLGSAAKTFALPQQLSGTPYQRVAVSDRVLFDSWLDGGWPQEQTATGWVTRSLVPAQLAETAWRTHKIFVDADGSLLVFLRGPKSPGAVALVRWQGAQSQVLYYKKALSSIRLAQTVRSADGRFWTEDRGLRYFKDNKWVAAPVSQDRFYDAKMLGPWGAQWLGYDRRTEGLFAFPKDPNGPDHMHHVIIKGSDGYANDLTDAIPYRSGYLLASSEGVLLLRNPAHPAAPAPLPTPRAVKRIASAGNGDLWFVGEGIWRLPKDAEKCERMLGALESLDASSVFEISADPRDPDDVWLTLGDRGVIHLHLETTP